MLDSAFTRISDKFRKASSKGKIAMTIFGVILAVALIAFLSFLSPFIITGFVLFCGYKVGTKLYNSTSEQLQKNEVNTPPISNN